MSKKIYVGNISFKATEDAVRELFLTVGEVESVNIITDSYTGQSKGFGFVEMSSEEDASKAIETLNGTTFMERTLSVAEARQKRRSGSGFGGKRGSFNSNRGQGWRRR
ncbi:MAG: RNA-binding protein [Deltaproteobacteria bacterium]|nr:RNA-binding protein [Deltaproteobacteria bacterium]